MSFSELLHPDIAREVEPLLSSGRHREALVNGVTLLFDCLREKSGLDSDGGKLVDDSLKLAAPRILLANLQTQNGRSIQSGYMYMLKGFYCALRNASSHRLESEYSELEVRQYLVALSAPLAKIENARFGNIIRTDGVYRVDDGFGLNFLRFYPDGLVISTSTASSSIEYVEPWFKYPPPNTHVDLLPRGSYTIDETEIKFSTTSGLGLGIIEYSGNIVGQEIRLNEHIKTTNRRLKNVYKFHCWPNHAEA